MRVWERSENYAGKDLSGYRILYRITRDSGILDQSNYDICLSMVCGLEGIEFHRFRHWAHGYVNSILVRPDAPSDTVKVCEEIDRRLTEREWDFVAERWNAMALRDRIHYCANSYVSIFAARRNYEDLEPDTDTSYLFDRLRGGI